MQECPEYPTCVSISKSYNLHPNSFIPKQSKKAAESMTTEVEPLNSFRFSPGLNQQFSTCAFKVDLGPANFHESDITTFREDYFPIVIGIETIFPDKYKGKAKRSIEYTYGTFYRESGIDLTLKYKPLKQKLLVSLFLTILTYLDSIIKPFST